MIDFQLEGKVVLITDANHGIGAATAQAFAAQGARVFIAYYHDTCPCSEKELRQARESGIGGDALYRALQQQAIEPLVEAIRSPGAVAAAYTVDLGVGVI